MGMTIHKLKQPTIILSKLYLPGYCYLSYKWIVPQKPTIQYLTFDELDKRKYYYVYTNYSEYVWESIAIAFDKTKQRWCDMMGSNWSSHTDWRRFLFSTESPKQTNFVHTLEFYQEAIKNARTQTK